MSNRQRAIRRCGTSGTRIRLVCNSVVVVASGFLAGCGISIPETGADEAVQESQPAAGATIAERERDPSDATPPAASGGPTIIATPAAGGGVVVGDPLDSGRSGESEERSPAAAPVAATPPAATTSTATPRPFGIGTKERLADRGRGDDDDASPAVTGSTLGTDPATGAQPPAGGAGTVGGGGRGRIGGFVDRGIEDSDEASVPVQPAAGAAAGVPNSPAPGLLRGRGGRRARGDDDRGGDGGAGVVGPNGEVTLNRETADDVAASFLNLVAAGDIERAKTLIGGRASGLLTKLRDGKMPEDELTELQTLVASRQEVNSRPKGGRHMLFTYSTSEDKMILLEAEHKEGDSSVVKLELHAAPRRRR